MRLLFARRYLFAPAARSVVNRIAWLSVAAVAVPVAAMIVLLSVFNGFERLVRANCSAFDAELSVVPAEGKSFDAAALDTAALRRTHGVAAGGFILEERLLVERDGHRATATLRGVDDAYAEVLPIGGAVRFGSDRLEGDDGGPRLVIGQTMAYRLGIHSLGDAAVDLYAVRRGRVPALLPTANYIRRTVPVGGLFTLDMESEQNYLLAPIGLARTLFSRPGGATAFVVRCTDGADPERVRERVARAAGDGFRVVTRYEQRASFYRIMSYEKWGIFFIALLILVIASFSVVGALTVLIVEKRGDIATLRALGADRSLIRALFRSEGALVCTIGAAAGTAVGTLAVLLQQHFGIIEIPAETFLTKAYPVELRIADLGAVLASTAAVAALLVDLTVRTMIKRTEP